MENDNSKKITEFFVKYKKNLIAVVLLIVFIIILVICAGSKKEQSDTQAETEGVAVTTEGLQENLQKDADPELVDLMKDYYTAYAAGSIEELEMLAQPLSDNEKSYIETFADYYEEYQNITCYSAPGATEDSYLVSVVYDLKFKDVDTAAPGMDFFYVERDGKGNLYINNVYSAYNFNFLEEDLDANLYALIVAYEKSDDVVLLQQEVQIRYDEAIKSDENLANMVGGTLRNAMIKWKESIVDDTQEQETETEDTQTEDTQAEDDSQEDEPDDDTGTVKTTDICNVRKEPSTDAEILGKVDIGVKLKKLGTEGEWTKVEFQGEVGYIKSDLLKTVKKKS